MKRTIIKIDEEKCNGCGECIKACHEGVIAIISGVAKLVRADYCDGLGDCLPSCPKSAITLEEIGEDEKSNDHVECCSLQHENKHNDKPVTWPRQIKLVNPIAPMFDSVDLVIAADCTAYAYSNFYRDYLNKGTTIIGCPKLDNVDYSEKLTTILQYNDIKSVKIIKMEVPCCQGIVNMTKKALKNCGKMIPWQVITITIDGKIEE